MRFAVVLLLALCWACNPDPVPDLVVPLADCVQLDAGVASVLVQVLGKDGEPLDHAGVSWYIAPGDAGVTLDGGNSTDKEIVNDVVRHGICNATVNALDGGLAFQDYFVFAIAYPGPVGFEFAIAHTNPVSVATIRVAAGSSHCPPDGG
jgi:hypothetical protein